MDFSKIDTKADAARGRVYQYLHPQLRHPLFTGPGADAHGRLIDENLEHSPVTGRILGLESSKVKLNAKQIRDAAAAGRIIDASGLKFTASLITEFNGVENAGVKIEANEEGCLWFFGRAEDFAIQTLDAAKDASGFFQEQLPS